MRVKTRDVPFSFHVSPALSRYSEMEIEMPTTKQRNSEARTEIGLFVALALGMALGHSLVLIESFYYSHRQLRLPPFTS